MFLTAALAALLQGPTAAPPPTPQDSASAYLDPGARALVAGARVRRATVERSIDAYEVTARQRIHAGVTSVLRDRTLFGQETAVRIDWRRGETGTIRVLGAREATPAATRGVSLPEDLGGMVPDLAFDPDRLQLDAFRFNARVGVQRDDDTTSVTLGNGDDDDENLRSIEPLEPGSEAHYRFRSGDTTTVRLPDGSRLQMVELEVIPRRREFRLLRGSLWLDTQTHGVVRSVMTTARPFDLRKDVDEDLPAIVDAMRIRAVVRYVTVEYALWQGRFWLPRLVAVDAEASMGGLASFPVRFERSYADYTVTASATTVREAAAPRVEADSATVRMCREQAKAGDLVCQCEDGQCRTWRVEIPTDTAALLASADLPPPLADRSAALITGEEVESLARQLTPGFGDALPELSTTLPGLRTFRFNRVEGLSLGARASVTRGPLVVDGEARIGVADLEPNVELGIARETMFWRTRLAGYRRLTPFDPSSRALELGNSLSALLWGRDEADYFRATGVEIAGAPLRMGGSGYTWRVFAEHQHAVSKETDFSLARAWDDDGDVFREVRPADDADQAGAALALHRRFGSDRTPAQLITRLGIEGQTGDYEFGRLSALARVTAPSVGPFAVALEGAAGTTAGDVPLQGAWYVGGPQSVRGYAGALLGGTAFWRARAELATPLPAARLIVFGDAGWAGDRDSWELDPPLLSAGVGASLLDGLFRVDLSRALREPTGWRVDFYLDAAL